MFWQALLRLSTRFKQNQIARLIAAVIYQTLADCQKPASITETGGSNSNRVFDVASMQIGSLEVH
jgi:hypothetical protein